MANKKNKYYVVWKGLQPGIYYTWDECNAQIKGVAGARYKSFETLPLAQYAFQNGPESVSTESKVPKHSGRLPIVGVDAQGMTTILPNANPDDPIPELNSLAVDAACSGNPGIMEYQGVHVASRQRVFHFKAPKGTNNIGEFLAIVHGLAWLKKNNSKMILYSDSVTAMGWIGAKKCRSKLALTPETAPLFDVVRRAEAWLCNNDYSTQIRKWDTDLWGEIPADFNRK